MDNTQAPSKPNKYIVNYTLTQAAAQAIGEEIMLKSRGFVSRDEALNWLKLNGESLYWYEVKDRSPTSKLEKVILSESNARLKGLKRIPGTLQTFYETGMEGQLGLILYRDDQPPGARNPNFDPSKPESSVNFKNFQSHEGIHFIRKTDLLEVDGVIYDLSFDPQFAKSDAWGLSLYPRGFSKEELLKLFNSGKKAVVLTV